MIRMMNKFSLIFVILNLTLLILLLPNVQCSKSTTSSSSSSSSSLTANSAATTCKELNQWNCYSSKNEGYFCNSKDQSKTETRWYYDKGHCRKFNYKGCNGNRNRFCSKETCQKRCQGE